MSPQGEVAYAVALTQAGASSVTSVSSEERTYLVVVQQDQSASATAWSTGPPGPPSTIELGPVTTLPSGSSASASLQLLAPGEYRLHLGVPRGDTPFYRGTTPPADTSLVWLDERPTPPQP